MTSSPGGATEPQHIFYICSDCYDADTETCGRNAPSDLRIMPNGRWLCEDCFGENDAYDIGIQHDEAGEIGDKPTWQSLPIPPAYSSAPDSKLQAYRKALEASDAFIAFHRDYSTMPADDFFAKHGIKSGQASEQFSKLRAACVDASDIVRKTLAAGG